MEILKIAINPKHSQMHGPLAAPPLYLWPRQETLGFFGSRFTPRQIWYGGVRRACRVCRAWYVLMPLLGSHWSQEKATTVGTVASGELAATRLAATIGPAVPVPGQCPPSTFASLDPPPAWTTSSSRTQQAQQVRAGDSMGKPGAYLQDFTSRFQRDYHRYNCRHVNIIV